MSPAASSTHPFLGTNKQARILRSLLFSFALTPLLLLNESARRILSLEATLGALAIGMLLGIVAAIGLADIELQNANSATAAIGALVCICVATIIVWLMVPHQYIGTVLQCTIAFIWAMPVTELIYHRLRVSDSS